MKRRRLVAAGLLLAGFALFLIARGELLSPQEQIVPVEVTVDVLPGMSFSSLTAALHRAGLVEWPRVFRIYAAWHDLDRGIQPGRYRLSAAMDYPALLRTLSNSKNALRYSVTVPEGFNLVQTAERFEEAGIMSADDFLVYVSDSSRSRKMAGKEAATLEGYLFPDTYDYSPLNPPEHLIDYMVRRALEKITPEMLEAAARQGLGRHELVTLASIIEKEAVLPEERPVIASVYHNRLRRRMPLQADPTVLYAKGGNGGNTIYRSDLQRDHPYNTYTRPGLPPGPICSPGEASLWAAARPAKTNFLYFVARGDGSGAHVFSRTLAEHNRAVLAARRRAADQ